MPGWMTYQGLQLPARTPRNEAGKILRDDLMAIADQIAEPSWGSQDPSGFIATAISADEIDLAWSDHADFEAVYVIDRATFGPDGPWTTIHTTEANAESYSDTGLTGSTRYYYRLRGIFGPFYSKPLFADATTTNFTVPGTPTGLSATAVGGSQINLSWTAPTSTGGSPITGYKIERESPVGGGWSTLVSNTGSTATTFSDIGLSHLTEYNYRVSARNAAGAGSPSTSADATTTDDAYPPCVFDFPFATDADDVSGNGNDATLTGGASIDSGSLLLNGSPAYAQVPVGIAGVGNGWTASCLFKPSSTWTSGNGCVAGQWITGTVNPNSAMWLQYKPTGTGSLAIGAAGNLVGNPWYGSGMNDGEWHHVVGRLSNSGVLSLWLDGVKIYDSGSTTRNNVTGNNVRIGMFQGTSEYFRGRIKKAKGWHQPLSDAEVIAVYEADTAL